jgi:predicted transcriptional regulator
LQEQGGVAMADKRLSIRISDELWQRARIIMTKRNRGENFQSICEQAIQEYVEKYEKEDKENKKTY